MTALSTPPRLSLSSLSGNGSKDGTIDNLARCIVLHFLIPCLGTVNTMAFGANHDNTAATTVFKYSIAYCNDGHLVMNSRPTRTIYIVWIRKIRTERSVASENELLASVLLSLFSVS